VKARRDNTHGKTDRQTHPPEGHGGAAVILPLHQNERPEQHDAEPHAGVE